jgi:hypothetical protein
VVNGSRSVDQETTIRHSLAILIKVMSRVGGEAFHVTPENRGGAVGAGEIVNPHDIAEHSLPGIE